MNEEEYRNDIISVAIIIAVLVILFAVFTISYYATDGFTNFCEEEGKVYNGEGEELESGTVYELTDSLAFTGTTADGISLRAVIKPDNATDKRVNWSLAFADGSTEYEGKTVDEYISLSVNNDVATIGCLLPFGKVINLTVVSVDDPALSYVCRLDYLERFTDSTSFLFELGENGSSYSTTPVNGSYRQNSAHYEASTTYKGIKFGKSYDGRFLYETSTPSTISAIDLVSVCALPTTEFRSYSSDAGWTLPSWLSPLGQISEDVVTANGYMFSDISSRNSGSRDTLIYGFKFDWEFFEGLLGGTQFDETPPVYDVSNSASVKVIEAFYKKKFAGFCLAYPNIPFMEIRLEIRVPYQKELIYVYLPVYLDYDSVKVDVASIELQSMGSYDPFAFTSDPLNRRGEAKL